MIPNYRDRFCPIVNEDVYHFGSFPTPQETPKDDDNRLYSKFLTETLLGFDPEKIPSVFSRRIQPMRDPFSLYPVSAPPVKPIHTIFDSNKQLYIGAAPGMMAISTTYSRPMAALRGSSFLMITGKILHVAPFSEDGTIGTPRTLFSMHTEHSITHVASLDGHTGIVIADTAGRIIFAPNGVIEAVYQSPGPVVDMIGGPEPTFLCGTVNGTIVTGDIRTIRPRDFSVGRSLRAFARHPNVTDLLSVATDDAIKIYDGRRTDLAVKEIKILSPVTSMAWYPGTEKSILFVGQSSAGYSALSVLSMQQDTLTPLTSVKTSGVVRSILCSPQHDCLATMQDSAESKSVTLWSWDVKTPQTLSIRQVILVTNGLSPSSGVIGDDGSLLVAYPSTELFAHIPLRVAVPPKPALGILPPDPYCLR